VVRRWSNSLPSFDGQGLLFGSAAVVARELFDQEDRYSLFAERIWPVIAGAREASEWDLL
jgi:hypothetical protein